MDLEVVAGAVAVGVEALVVRQGRLGRGRALESVVEVGDLAVGPAAGGGQFLQPRVAGGGANTHDVDRGVGVGRQRVREGVLAELRHSGLTVADQDADCGPAPVVGLCLGEPGLLQDLGNALGGVDPAVTVLVPVWTGRADGLLPPGQVPGRDRLGQARS